MFKLFRKKLPPCDVMLVFDYEHEEPLRQCEYPLPLHYDDSQSEKFDGSRSVLLKAKPPRKNRKRKKKTEEKVGFIVSPDGVPEHKSNKLVLRNISTTPAINVVIPPLKIQIPIESADGEETKFLDRFVNFDPCGFSLIMPGGSVEVEATYQGMGAIECNNLPHILALTDSSKTINDFFNEVIFELKINYETSLGRRFTTFEELIFRPWKKKASMGRLRREEITNANL